MTWASLHARGRAYLPRRHAFAAIAQLGARQTEDLKVPGSIPGGGTALVAQLVEHGSNKPRVGGSSPSWSTLLLFFCNHGVFYGCARREHPFRSYSVMVITKDSESFDPGSSPGRTFCSCRGGFPVFVATGPSNPVLVAQLDKASDYESEDWGFKSLQGLISYIFYLKTIPHELFCFQLSRRVAGKTHPWRNG